MPDLPQLIHGPWARHGQDAHIDMNKGLKPVGLGGFDIIGAIGAEHKMPVYMNFMNDQPDDIAWPALVNWNENHP